MFLLGVCLVYVHQAPAAVLTDATRTVLILVVCVLDKVFHDVGRSQERALALRLAFLLFLFWNVFGSELHEAVLHPEHTPAAGQVVVKKREHAQHHLRAVIRVDLLVLLITYTPLVPDCFLYESRYLFLFVHPMPERPFYVRYFLLFIQNLPLVFRLLTLEVLEWHITHYQSNILPRNIAVLVEIKTAK